jgi:hypothetical protein
MGLSAVSGALGRISESAATIAGAASAQVLVSAQSLSRASHHLKGEVEKFLATVRAA